MILTFHFGSLESQLETFNYETAAVVADESLTAFTDHKQLKQSLAASDRETAVTTVKPGEAGWS